MNKSLRHPGEVLLKRYMEPKGITRHDMSGVLEMPYVRVVALLSGGTSITATMAIRLSEAFGTRAEYWMEMQNAYDLSRERGRLGKQGNEVGKKIKRRLEKKGLA